MCYTVASKSFVFEMTTWYIALTGCNLISIIYKIFIFCFVYVSVRNEY